MTESINTLTEAIWSAIQRSRPAITRDEIAAILREALDAPTADETPGKYEHVECAYRVDPDGKGNLVYGTSPAAITNEARARFERMAADIFNSPFRPVDADGNPIPEDNLVDVPMNWFVSKGA